MKNPCAQTGTRIERQQSWRT